jgi:peroxiredoxin
MVQAAQYAPELKVAGWLQGEPVKISDLRGKNVLLHMFQVNCPGCFHYSIPYACKMHELYSGKGLEVIGIAVRFEEEEWNTRENFEAFVKDGKLTPKVQDSLLTERKYRHLLNREDGGYKLRIKHRVAYDTMRDGGISETMRAYYPSGTPFEFLINKEGRVVDRFWSMSLKDEAKDFFEKEYGGK